MELIETRFLSSSAGGSQMTELYEEHLALRIRGGLALGESLGVDSLSYSWLVGGPSRHTMNGEGSPRKRGVRLGWVLGWGSLQDIFFGWGF